MKTKYILIILIFIAVALIGVLIADIQDLININTCKNTPLNELPKYCYAYLQNWNKNKNKNKPKYFRLKKTKQTDIQNY